MSTEAQTPYADEMVVMELSCLTPLEETWQTASQYRQTELSITGSNFHSATDVLLASPNLNSTHLFRADILYDSSGDLKTPAEHEIGGATMADLPKDEVVAEKAAAVFEGYRLKRTVIRRLIPRKPQLDKSLVQACYIYESVPTISETTKGVIERHLVIYRPYAESSESMPWYHPPVKALAYLYEKSSAAGQASGSPSISIHFLPFTQSTSDLTIPTRLHRTFVSLLQTMVRLSKGMSRPPGANTKAAPKDNIIPQHVVQNTYSRLKQTYSKDLINQWVEKTEPSKHVFEDLMIAAFLIELWRQMYGATPKCERPSTATASFPGFVDIACGNGVLVYVLIEEGYSGWGFDARRRRTWDIFPDIQDRLLEMVLIPKPFLQVLERASTQEAVGEPAFHNGIFQPGTFIISNHADELTPWTPLLAALSCPSDPLPWLAIPCCSHALSGARYRYPVPKTSKARSQGQAEITTSTHASPEDAAVHRPDQSPQPATGDLKTLRAVKSAAASGADQTSMYACLTNKVVALAEELGCEIEKTLMRIPSTRNIGIIGRRRHVLLDVRGRDGRGEEAIATPPVPLVNLCQQATSSSDGTNGLVNVDGDDGIQRRASDLSRQIQELIARECKISGGIEAAARIWVERAKGLQSGKGRGKVNLGRDHE